MPTPGYFIYKGITILQNKDIVKSFTELITKYKPSRILEIGTAAGGLTLLLRDLLDQNNCKDADFKTYDIENGDWSRSEIFIKALETRKIDSILQNIFIPDTMTLQDETCVDYIQSEGTSLIICDGGNKALEFNILSKYLKSGDIIMAHDYAYSREFFDNAVGSRKWDFCEIVESDIQQSSILNNLTNIMEEEFVPVGWCCKIKK